MLDFRELINTDFSLLESVKTYKNMVIMLLPPMVKTAFVVMIFIFFGQSLLSLFPYTEISNICFWIWAFFVFSVAGASFFKTSEDIVLNKTAQIYKNISHILAVSVKLLAVIGIILGALALLIVPAFYITNPLFALPYKALVTIFIIAVLPFIYFAPLAVVLREAKIINSFTFSYYMALERWGQISKSILAQMIFVGMIAFWVYLIVSVLFFPNSSDFFSFMFKNAPALKEQARNLYVRFVFWEAIQIFVFTMISAIFIGANTVLFLFLEGTIFKIVQNYKKVSSNTSSNFNEKRDVKFVDILAHSKTVVIDIKEDGEEGEEEHNRRRHSKG